jgi:predicted acyltransferase
MTLTPIPGYGVDNLSPEGNLAAYLDRLVFSSVHLYGKIFDPEGLLSTLPAIATTLLGNITGYWLRTQRADQSKLQWLIIMGACALAAGWIWGWWFPINKNLWTSSFVLWTAGLACILLALCYWLIEVKKFQRWAIPFEIFGVNAIAAYFLHLLLLKIQVRMLTFPRPDGTLTDIRIIMTEHLFGWASAKNASLLYAICYVIFILFVLTILYRKRIFIKI